MSELPENWESLPDTLDLLHPSKCPPASALLKVLSAVEIAPISWDFRGNPVVSQDTTELSKLVSDPKLPRWLTGLVSNELSWVTDEEREKIYEEAGKRLSERCGRVAMPAMTREFMIPLITASDSGSKTSTDGGKVSAIEEAGVDGVDYVKIALYEPSITSDNLGFKTWASSLLLARKLATLKFPPPSRPGKGMKTLELGSGTGLVGIACAAVLGADVTLTDLDEIVPNLERNVTGNFMNAKFPDGTGLQLTSLDWRKPEDSLLFPRSEEEKFQLVVAADAVYDDEHPKLVTDMIGLFLSRAGDARALVEIPLRPRFEAQREEFWRLAREMGLRLEESGEEEGVDDWGTGSEEGDSGKVRCWWGMYKWDDVVQV